MTDKYPKIGEKVWVLRMSNKKGYNYETSPRFLKRATVIGYEILTDSPSGRKRPTHGDEYLYKGELYDFSPTYYGLVDEMGNRIFEPCTLNTHYHDVSLTYKEALKDLIFEIGSQQKELKFCIDKNYRQFRGKKKKRLLRKLEERVQKLKLEYESLT